MTNTSNSYFECNQQLMFCVFVATWIMSKKLVGSIWDTTEGLFVRTSLSDWECEKKWKFSVSEYIYVRITTA